MRLKSFGLVLVGGLVMGPLAPLYAEPAGDGFNPFTDRDTARPVEQPAQRQAMPAVDARPADPRDRTDGTVADPSGGVVREDLAPVMAGDGSGVPLELWNGLTLAQIETLFASLEIPPRSPVLYGLFKRLITADVTAPAGSKDASRFLALQIEALDRSGLTSEAAKLFEHAPEINADPALDVMRARAAIGTNDRERACGLARGFATAQTSLSGRLKGEAILISAYCAAAAGNTEAASLQAQLAREQGVDASAGLDALELMAAGAKPKISKGTKIGLLDWQILVLAGAADLPSVITGAAPGLLASIARSAEAEPAIRLLAGERAAALNAISADDLAAIYREQPLETASASDVGTNPETVAAAAVRRAGVFKLAEAERTPLKKARLIRSFLDDARRAGLYWPALQMIAFTTATTASRRRCAPSTSPGTWMRHSPRV